MNRNELLTALKLCRPALAGNELIPVLTHYCFDTDRVFAYNDVMAIVVDADVGISCALPGDPLYRVVDSFSSDEVHLEELKTAIEIRGKTKKAKVTMPFLTSHSFLYRDPADEEIVEDLDLSEETVEAIQFCLASVPDSPVLPYQMGLTISNAGWIYASDGTTVAYADTDFRPKSPLLLPSAFCKQIVALTSDETDTIALGADFAQAVFHPRMSVFTKLPFDAEVGRFEKVLDEHVPNEAVISKGAFTLPKQLLPCLDRCMAVLSGDLDKTLSVTVDGSGFDVRVESKLGTVDEQFSAKTGIVKEAMYWFDVEVLRKCILNADKMAFLRETIALVTEGVGVRLLAQKGPRSED